MKEINSWIRQFADTDRNPDTVEIEQKTADALTKNMSADNMAHNPTKPSGADRHLTPFERRIMKDLGVIPPDEV